jgi:hypothetical protein
VSAAAISAFSVGAEHDVALVAEGGAERAERVEVRVQPPAADRVAAGRRHVGVAEARQERACEQERGADALGVRAVDVRVAVDARRAQAHLVVVAPLDAHADPAQHAQHRLDVPDARDVADHDLLGGQHRGGEDRQRAVLVAGGDDRAFQRRAAVDDELLHTWGRRRRGQRALG